jgi:hypothetical protein
MALTVTLDLPVDVEEKLRKRTPDLETDIRRAYALELFRRGELSHVELSAILGLDRFDTDAFLKSHHIYDGSPTMADLEADSQTLEHLMDKRR